MRKENRMADKVHVQAASGRWVWVPTSELEDWKKQQDKIRAGLSQEEEREFEEKAEEDLRRISEWLEAPPENTES